MVAQVAATSEQDAEDHRTYSVPEVVLRRSNRARHAGSVTRRLRKNAPGVRRGSLKQHIGKRRKKPKSLPKGRAGRKTAESNQGGRKCNHRTGQGERAPRGGPCISDVAKTIIKHENPLGPQDPIVPSRMSEQPDLPRKRSGPQKSS